MCGPVFPWLLVFYVLLCSLLMYSVSLANYSWVTTDTHTWGLWVCCDRNASDVNCTVISTADCPGYFDGVRVMGVVTGLLYVIYMILVFATSKVWPMNTVIVFYYLSGASTVMLHGLNYQTDGRWRDSNPTLGAGFWAACGCLSLNLLLFLLLGATRPDLEPLPARHPTSCDRRCAAIVAACPTRLCPL